MRRDTTTWQRPWCNSLGRYSKDLLSDALTNIIKAGFEDCVDPNECWQKMEDFLIAFLNMHCPIKVFRTKDNPPALVTRDVILIAKDRDRAWKQAKLTNRDEDWKTARQLRNRANNAIKAAKAQYIKNELDNNTADPKKFWRNIKAVLPDQKTGNINLVNPLTKEPLPKDMQAQEINHFFANVGQRLGKRFKGDRPEFQEVDNQPPRLEVRHITQVEVLKLIDTISIYKSSGLDNISSNVVKDFMSLANKQITFLYNMILDTGIFPDKWKIATVTPIPKVANATEATDLRPISLLPVPGKLLEKYITVNMQSFLEGKNYFTDSQNGFRAGKSTASALSTLLDNIVTDLNASKTNVVTFLDFKKAFDTIDHIVLMRKLKQSGLGTKLLNLLENYLSNRKQKTTLFNAMSTLEEVNIGVPQGSTVRPIMFIVYINDLVQVLKHCKPLMYADDTVIFCSHDNNKQVRKMMQEDLCRNGPGMVFCK